ncbi:MAG: hypothetical protein ACK5PB_23745 [Pirellula sp.]|jgi:hypothetical protein
MQKALVVTLASILIVVAVAAYSQERESDRRPGGGKAGKVLSVTTIATGGSSVYIQDPIVKKLERELIHCGDGSRHSRIPPHR